MVPRRVDYLQQQADSGRLIMGVLPAVYPREILWAFDILPAEIWDPPGEIIQANAHLQATICPVVKRGLEFILTNSDLVNSGYLFPHTCDSLQNLGSLVKDLLHEEQSIFSFYNPKAGYSPASRKFYRHALQAFVKELEQEHGALDTDKLINASKVGARLDQLRRMLNQARLEDKLDLSNADYYALLRSGEYLWPDDSIALLEQSLSRIDENRTPSIKIVVSGILPPQPDLLELLDSLGVRIVADDLLALNRRVPISVTDVGEDPFEYLSDRYFLLPPCSTQANSVAERLRFLDDLASDNGLSGVLLNIMKFCEPELFDQRALLSFFKSKGIPVLVLESELEPALSGQLVTRVEAFVELLKDRMES